MGESKKRRSTAPRDLDFSASEWVKHKLGFVPDAIQTRLLNTASKRVLLNCTRQWGKSTTTAAKAVHHAFTVPETLTLVVSPSGRQSGEFIRKAATFMKRLGLRVKGDGDNGLSLAFPNGSRLVGLPGNEDTVRGFSAVSLLLVDEASRVSDDLYLAVRPMLAASDGTMWLLSTPHGKRGFFYEAWDRGGGDWERARAMATECARIRPAFLEQEKKTMGDRCFRQEYLCEFVDPVCAIFDRDLIEQAFSDEFQPMRFD